MTELKEEISRLKKERNAVILAHNYQLEEVQVVADYVGDSFYLSKIAAKADAEVIVFCGVRFMAETAKFLSPEKTVLLPEVAAGCPLADTITAQDIEKIKQQHTDAAVVCYINSSAEVKAASDICCTSSNAVKIAASLPNKKLIFVPDKNLGDYIAKQLPDKEFVFWEGCCPTHAQVTPVHVEKMRASYPGAQLLIHPECYPEVTRQADFAGSTSEIIRFAENSTAQVFLIGTEIGVLHALKASQPQKQFVLLHEGLVCPDMKKTNLHSVYNTLVNNCYEITNDKALFDKARQAISRMLELA